MKTKILFILILLLLQCEFIFSQCINIELSVKWEEEFNIFYKKTKVSIPKLNITYRNDCNTNYYFLNLSPQKDETPIVGCSISLHGSVSRPQKRVEKPNNYLKRLKANQGVFANLNYNVIIGIEPSIDIGWFICGDNVGVYDENATWASCILKSFYEYLYPEYNRNYKSRYADFLPSGMIPDSIMFGSVNKQFVFLKAGETFTVSYNLLGFQLVEGCFTFMLDKNKIENFVTIFPKLDFAITSYGYKKVELPAIVGDYHLFSGAFNSNKTTVCFGER